jgi:hypothetical protein
MGSKHGVRARVFFALSASAAAALTVYTFMNGWDIPH